MDAPTNLMTISRGQLLSIQDMHGFVDCQKRDNKFYWTFNTGEENSTFCIREDTLDVEIATLLNKVVASGTKSIQYISFKRIVNNLIRQGN